MEFIMLLKKIIFKIFAVFVLFSCGKPKEADAPANFSAGSPLLQDQDGEVRSGIQSIVVSGTLNSVGSREDFNNWGIFYAAYCKYT